MISGCDTDGDTDDKVIRVGMISGYNDDGDTDGVRR